MLAITHYKCQISGKTSISTDMKIIFLVNIVMTTKFISDIGPKSALIAPRPLITVGQGPIALAVREGGGGLDIFTLIYPFASFSLSLGDGPI